MRGSYDLKRERVLDLMRVITVLAKSSISPTELVQLLGLINPEVEFPYRFEVLDLLSEIASEVLAGQNAWISDYWNIQRSDENITVPEIEQWSGNTPLCGFVFHASVCLRELRENLQCNDESAKYFFRRQLLYLGSDQGTGFEVFLSQDGSLSVAATTKKDYYAVTCSEAKLFDNKWHTVTVAVVPSKRPFSYFNVTIYKDGECLLSTKLKISTAHERFTVCSIGAPPAPQTGDIEKTSINAVAAPQQVAAGASVSGRSLFPSIFEKALPSIVSQAPNYFTLPLKGFSSHDASVKLVANGLQDNIFGAATSLQGLLASVLLSDSGLSVKPLFEAGENNQQAKSYLSC